MYAKEDRSKYLALFFLSIPIGRYNYLITPWIVCPFIFLIHSSGIGFILFSVVTNLANDWRYVCID